MAGRKRSPQVEASPPDVSAEGASPDEPQPGESAPTPDAPAEEASPPPHPASPPPPHPVKRYRVAPAAHLGTRVGGFVLTERGWIPASAPQQTQE